MRHRRFLLMLLARSPVPSHSRRCSVTTATASGPSCSSASVSASAATAAATAATPIPATTLASRFAALRLSSGSSLLRGGPRASPGRRCTALPPARALFSSRKVEETGTALFATKTRMTISASAEAPAPELAAPAAAAAAVHNPSSGAAPAPHPPSSSLKREREQGGGSNGMQPQQQNNSAAAATAAADGEGRAGGGGGGKRGRRSKRPLTPETLLRKEVHASARRQDARAALAAYDSYLELLRGENERARAERAAAAAGERREDGGGGGEAAPSPPPPYYLSPLWDPASSLVHLSSDVRNSLLYLCAGGDAWDAELAGPEARERRRAASGSVVVVGGSGTAAAAAAEPAVAPAPPSSDSPLPAEELARRGREIFDRTTSCLADVERPLSTGRRNDGGSAAAAATTDGNDPAAASAPAFSPPEHLQQLSGDGEMSFTALARMAARARDPRGSLAAAREAVALGYPARLRCFSPAILAFAAEGDARSAFDVEREAREEHGLEMTEPELGFLASAAAAANNNSSNSSSSSSVPFETVESVVLAALTREHGRLQRETVAALEGYFASLGSGNGEGEEAADAANKKWRVGRARVDPRTGSVLVPSSSSSSPSSPSSDSPQEAAFTQDSLGPVDLEPHEWDAFSSGVAALARARERSPPGAFDAFADWAAANGPFDAVVDGANVALYGQNWAHGDFSFAQLEAVVEELKLRLGPGSKTLVVLHRSRLLSPAARDAEGRRVLGSFASEAVAPSSSSSSSADAAPAQVMLYAAPHGSNDDWYWLHAAVAAGEKGLVVSNDEMRDHVFQLLSPRFAARWKDRHRAKYTFHGNYHVGSSAAGLHNNNGRKGSYSSYGSGHGGYYGGSGGVSAQLFFPAPFSECSQRVPKTGAWLFPRAVAAAASVEEGGAAEDAGKRSGGSGGEDDPDEWLCCSPVP